MRVIPALLVLCVTGCASPEPSHSLRWKKSDFIGKTFSLDHPTIIQEISFYEDHRLAPVTFGSRDGKYIEVCGPLMYWRLRGTELEVYDYDKKVYEAFTLISKDAHTITVKNRNGKLVRYQAK